MAEIPNITINCDASFHPVHKVGGYAFWIKSDDFKITKAGSFKSDPINCEDAEIMCIANALHVLLNQESLPAKIDFITLNCDSTNALKRIDKAIEIRRKYNNNKRQKDVAIKAAMIWIKLCKRLNPNFEQFKHVKAHTKSKDSRSYVNDWCDKEARRWMRIKVKQQ
jgi:ribonuclease HI